MNTRLRIGTLCLAAFTLGAVAAAQQGVTFVLRSGERVSGELLDMGADFTLRVNGEDRHVPISNVAIIDFVGGGQGLPATELSKIPASGHLTILRGGESFTGQLVDISGTPMQLVFSTGQGERRVSASTIGRVYLARPDNMPAAGAATAQTEMPAGPTRGVSIDVPANVLWTDSGITVRQGDRVSFRASGEIRLSRDSGDVAGPAGSAMQRYARRAPIPRVLAGALIGRVGSSAPFGIGDQTAPLQMPAFGALFLGVNDDDLRDNTGQFTVVIDTGATRRGRRR